MADSLFTPTEVPQDLDRMEKSLHQLAVDYELFSLLAAGDTLYAGTDSLFYVGLGGGALWSTKSSPVPRPDVVGSILKPKGVLLAGSFRSAISAPSVRPHACATILSLRRSGTHPC